MIRKINANPCMLLTRTIFAISTAITANLATASVLVMTDPSQDYASVCANAESMKQIPCPDSELFRSEGERPVQWAFGETDFKRLDALYTQWCTGKDRFPDGRWKLAEYESGLASIFPYNKNWGKDLSTIKAWQKSNPKSEAAMYAEASYWRQYAWEARGTGMSSTISKEGWELFKERLEKSINTLTRLNIQSSSCPAPYALTIKVLTDMGATDKQLSAVYSEGARRFPEYHNIYFSMARHYEPKWGGSIAQYEAFASEVAEHTKAFEGMGMYARLYWLVDNRYDIPFSPQLSTPPRWNKLHVGYEDLMHRYPSSLHNLIQYTNVVCRSNDSQLYKQLREKLVNYENITDSMYDPIDVCDRRHGWKPKTR